MFSSRLLLLLCALLLPAAIYAQNLASCPKTLEYFVDELPMPKFIQPFWNSSMQYPLYTVEMSKHAHKLHRDLNDTMMWLYNKQFPGPTFEVEAYDKIHIKFINNLPPGEALLPVNDLGMNMPPDRTVVHLHGSVSKPQYCGLPLDTIRPVAGRNSYVNYHANQQEATLLWYHDHAMQITGPNVYSGLVGTYIIRDDHERSLNLPRKQYEIPLVVADREVNLTTGQLIYSRRHAGANFQTVNGKIWPFKEVEPGKYRFRILNAANHRFYNFSFSNNMPFSIIGVDLGFLKKAVTVRNLFLGPAERADIIVDFSGYANKNITLMNSANEALSGQPPNNCTAAIIMQFRVGRKMNNEYLHGVVPSGRMYNYDKEKPDHYDVRHRNFTLNLERPAFKFMINGEPFHSKAEHVALGDTELLGADHPIHIHMVGFYILERIPLNVTQARNGIVEYIGDPIPVPPSEYGRKDVVFVPGHHAVRIVMTFTPYPGEFVFHCHLLEHEDDDMMSDTFIVSPIGPDCQWDEDQTDEDCDFYD